MLYALEKKLYFREQLPKVLQAKAMPMVTKCIVAEIRKNEQSDNFGAALMAKRLEHIACGHDDHPISAEECVKSVLASQPKTFLIATQNANLQRALERIPGVPTLFFFNNVLTIVKPSNFERNIAGLVRFDKLYHHSIFYI
jgi:U3 small nucleolar RNA-associated protein 23